jgi:hypothetical protein
MASKLLSIAILTAASEVMVESEKVIESIRFLLSSLSKLSDRFLATNESTQRSFDNVRQDINDVIERLALVEADLVVWRDQSITIESANMQRRLELPAKEEHKKRLIPALNLPLETIVDIYRNTPSLLQPFSRPCSFTAKTVTETSDIVELEVAAQGLGWMIETQYGDWLLLPKPGMLNRASQYKTLERMFQFSANDKIPAEIELIKPARGDAIEHGRRWLLAEKGQLGIYTDPLQQSLENRLRQLEARLKALELS